jgi:hypothetical protein
MVKEVPAHELFNDEQLARLEHIVQTQPPMFPIIQPSREFPRFISLGEELERVARLLYEGVRHVEYDVDTEMVRLYF